MARHSREDKKTSAEIDVLRRKVLDKFFDLSDAAFEHIKTSMSAQTLCRACDKDKDGNHLPGKARNLEGACAFCNGTYLIPDNDQRNWAFEQAGDRFAPKPKALEISDSTGMDKEETEKEFSRLSNLDLDKKLEILGLGTGTQSAG